MLARSGLPLLVPNASQACASPVSRRQGLASAKNPGQNRRGFGRVLAASISTMVRGSVGPIGRFATISRFLHFWTVVALIP